MSTFRPIFNTVFHCTIEDDDLDLFFKSAWNKYRNDQKRKSGETYVTGRPINRRSELGKKRLAELKAAAIDVEFIEC